MLDLDNKHAKVGVINNRIEKHGDKDVTAFDIPLTVLLDPKELNNLLDDPYKHRALFETKGDVATPMFPEFSEFAMKHDLEGATVTLHIGHSGFEIEYKDSCLKGLVLAPLHGGETQLDFKLQCNPQTKHIVKLLDAQNTEIKLSVADAKIAEKKKRKQRELPLGPDPKADQDDEGEPGKTTTPLYGNAPVRDETLVWWQTEAGENSCGKRCDMPQGCVEIDPPAGGESEQQQIEAQLGETSAEITGDGSGTAAAPLDDSEQFAEGVAKALGAHKKRGRAIDGRSERVKHQDRQKDAH
jgi:hypothetical protein